MSSNGAYNGKQNETKRKQEAIMYWYVLYLLQAHMVVREHRAQPRSLRVEHEPFCALQPVPQLRVVVDQQELVA